MPSDPSNVDAVATARPVIGVPDAYRGESVADLPNTTTGKIRRTALREDHED